MSNEEGEMIVGGHFEDEGREKMHSILILDTTLSEFDEVFSRRLSFVLSYRQRSREAAMHSQSDEMSSLPHVRRRISCADVLTFLP